ncbi:MAG: hypothetical protein ACXW2A_19415 [Burkholderiales bacterium]
MILDFKYWEGDKIDLSLTNVSYFGGQDTTPELNEVSYWRYNNGTVVSFNDRGQIHDILLDNFSQNMISTDFIL